MQSNQYPRARHPDPSRAAGIAVSIGGFHVSGCLSMLDGHAVVDACREMGVAIFAGGPRRAGSAARRRGGGISRAFAYGRTCRASRARCHFLPGNTSSARSARAPASTPAAAALPVLVLHDHINVQGLESTPLATTTWNRWCASTGLGILNSSSPTTISRATRVGSIFDRLIALRREGRHPARR